ncbi:MAG: hypothetical protein J0I06_13420 [Planctomycetes bacterium]|nr:hypothetical protein [Planctomycetota bacterium]
MLHWMLSVPRRVYAAGVLSAAMLFAGLGCGSGVAVVSGEVILDGTPIENGTITFEPADRDGPTMGGPITNGRYEVKGLPGKKKVLVTAFRLTGKKVPVNLPGTPLALGDEMRAFPPPGTNHEPKEVELTTGANTFSVKLTTPGGPVEPTKASAEPQAGPGPPR